MRSHAIVSLAFSIVCCGTATGGAIFVSGCGGHHTTVNTSSTPTPTPTPTPSSPTTVKATIVWPQRSRQASTTTSGSPVQIAALTADSSAVITFTGAGQTGEDIVIYANRPTGPASTTTTYTSTTLAKPGTYAFTARFYNKPLNAAGGIDATAVVVATAQANTQILPNGTLSATITTVGQIQSVVVTPGQTIALGATTPVAFTAYGAPVANQQVIIPVVAGAEQVSVANVDTSRPPVATVTNGLLTATAPGQARVIVTVDNISSDPTLDSSLIRVVSAQTVAISPNPATVPVGGQVTFTATTTAPTGSPVVWSLGTDAATQASGVTIDADTGVLTAPSRSGGPYTVIATSQYDLTKTATAAVTVTSNVAIFPTGQASTSRAATFSVGANRTISLPVTISGNDNTAVTYTVIGNTATSTPNGTVTQAGVFTAPDTEGTYTVTATSQADTAQVVTFTLIVTPSVTIAPRAITINVGQNATFFADVVGGTNKKVIYTVVGGDANGTITATGVYTAPFVVGTYKVTATSIEDPTESDTATIVVQAGSADIIIN